MRIEIDLDQMGAGAVGFVRVMAAGRSIGLFWLEDGEWVAVTAEQMKVFDDFAEAWGQLDEKHRAKFRKHIGAERRPARNGKTPREIVEHEVETLSDTKGQS